MEYQILILLLPCDSEIVCSLLGPIKSVDHIKMDACSLKVEIDRGISISFSSSGNIYIYIMTTIYCSRIFDSHLLCTPPIPYVVLPYRIHQFSRLWW